MSTRVVDLANELVRCLGNPPSPFSLSFTPERVVNPINSIEELKTLRVTVLDGTRKTERSTRDPHHPFRYTMKPVVLVQKKLAGNTAEMQRQEADELAGLVQEIERVLESAQVVGFALNGFDEGADSELFNLDVMRTFEVFSRAVQLEYLDIT